MSYALGYGDVDDFDMEVWASVDHYACFAGLGNIVVGLSRHGLGHGCHVDFRLGLLDFFQVWTETI